jgi:hypothetical protein
MVPSLRIDIFGSAIKSIDFSVLVQILTPMTVFESLDIKTQSWSSLPVRPGCLTAYFSIGRFNSPFGNYQNLIRRPTPNRNLLTVSLDLILILSNNNGTVNAALFLQIIVGIIPVGSILTNRELVGKNTYFRI